MNTREQYTPDQLEAIADLDRMKAYQEEYPEAYRTAYRELLNSPIDKAERTYTNGYNRLAGVMNTAERPIWQRETPPESMDADQWRTLAAIDRLHEHEWVATLA